MEEALDDRSWDVIVADFPCRASRCARRSTLSRKSLTSVSDRFGPISRKTRFKRCATGDDFIMKTGCAAAARVERNCAMPPCAASAGCWRSVSAEPANGKPGRAGRGVAHDFNNLLSGSWQLQPGKSICCPIEPACALLNDVVLASKKRPTHPSDARLTRKGVSSVTDDLSLSAGHQRLLRTSVSKRVQFQLNLAPISLRWKPIPHNPAVE